MANEKDKEDALYFQKLLFSEHGVIRFHFHANNNPAAHLLELINYLLPIRMSTSGFCVSVRSFVEVELTFERTRSASEFQNKEIASS